MCIQYQLHPVADIAFYVADVALPPLIFGLGVAGNLLLLMILNRRAMRQASAVHVYLAATAGVDLLTLLTIVPTYIRDLDLLPVPLGHSFPAVVVVWTCRAIEPILRHSTAWFMAIAASTRAGAVRFCHPPTEVTSLSSPLYDSPTRWTRISSSRVVAFIVFVGCALLDFTKFFDRAVVPMVNHCFDPTWSLWTTNRTRFGTGPIYVEIQPVASVLIGSAAPLIVAAVVGLALLVGAASCCRSRRSAILRVPADQEDGEYQLTMTVIVVVLTAVLLEGPRAAFEVVSAFNIRFVGDSSAYGQALRYAETAARSLSSFRCSINFVIVSLLYYDFRKTMHRMFCCCCPTPDDVFYEPVDCCGCRSRGYAKNVVDVDRRHQKTMLPPPSTSNSSAGSSLRKQRITAVPVSTGESTKCEFYPASDYELVNDIPPPTDGFVTTDELLTLSRGNGRGLYRDVDDQRALWI